MNRLWRDEKLEENEEKKELLVTTSMQIILHAGNARGLCSQAIDQAEAENFVETDQLMKQAEEEIANAHIAQTNIIQEEARGIEYPHSLLFTHAQDTLMTIKSELNMGKKFILIFKKLAKQVNSNEEMER